MKYFIKLIEDEVFMEVAEKFETAEKLIGKGFTEVPRDDYVLVWAARDHLRIVQLIRMHNERTVNEKK